MENTQSKEQNNPTPTPQERQAFLTMWERLTPMQKESIRKIMDIMLAK